jgi:hypothetical protein
MQTVLQITLVYPQGLMNDVITVLMVFEPVNNLYLCTNHNQQSMTKLFTKPPHNKTNVNKTLPPNMAIRSEIFSRTRGKIKAESIEPPPNAANAKAVERCVKPN